MTRQTYLPKLSDAQQQATRAQMKKRLGMTQKRLAEMLGINQSYFSNILRGKNSMPFWLAERWSAFKGKEQR